MAKKIIFCFLYKFIDGDASGLRFYNLALMFKKNGFDTTIIGFGEQNYKERIVTEDGIEIYSIRRFKSHNIIFKILNHFKNLYRVLTHFLLKLYKEADIIVLPLHYPTKFFKKIRTKIPNAKIIFSAMEEDSMFRFYPMEVAHKNNNINLVAKYIEKYCLYGTYGFGITENLTERMQKIGIKAITIPFIFDDNYFSINKKPHSKINFLYAGHPGKKDSLLLILEGFSNLPQNVSGNIHLNVVGVNESWLLRNKKGGKIYEKIRDFTTFHGYKSHDFVKELYEITDFSLLFRDPESPVSKAGFPTKISESLFNRTPTICNITSDLSSILTDKNSIIIEKYNIEELTNALIKALKLTSTEYLEMAKNAQETALTKLSTNNFFDKIMELLYDKQKT